MIAAGMDFNVAPMYGRPTSPLIFGSRCHLFGGDGVLGAFASAGCCYVARTLSGPPVGAMFVGACYASYRECGKISCHGRSARGFTFHLRCQHCSLSSSSCERCNFHFLPQPLVAVPPIYRPSTWNLTAR